MVSERSEFVAVYGRRRIGKTFLVNEAFGYSFAFHVAGLKREGLRRQLDNFRLSLKRQGLARFPENEKDNIRNGLESAVGAIELLLEDEVEKAMNTYNKKVVIDEDR